MKTLISFFFILIAIVGCFYALAVNSWWMYLVSLLPISFMWTVLLIKPKKVQYSEEIDEAKYKEWLHSLELRDGVFYDKDGNAVDCIDPPDPSYE